MLRASISAGAADAARAKVKAVTMWENCMIADLLERLKILRSDCID